MDLWRTDWTLKWSQTNWLLTNIEGNVSVSGDFKGDPLYQKLKDKWRTQNQAAVCANLVTRVCLWNPPLANNIQPIQFPSSCQFSGGPCDHTWTALGMALELPLELCTNSHWQTPMGITCSPRSWADLLKSLCSCKLSQCNFMDLVFIHHSTLQLRYFSKIEIDCII